MNTPVVRVQNVNLTLAGHQILNNISLEIFPREIVSLIGQNGAGKSTILKILLGIYQPTSGTVSLQTKRIGYVPQNLLFDPTIPFSVQEFLQTYSRKCTSQILQKLEEVEAPALAKKQIGQLSGGELKRVLMANALLQDPELLLLDEATAGVDIHGEKKFYQLLSGLHEKYNLTIVMVSHDIHTVFARSSKVICLHGHICCSGTPEHVRIHPEFTKLFGELVSPYEHHHTHTHK